MSPLDCVKAQREIKAENLDLKTKVVTLLNQVVND